MFRSAVENPNAPVALSRKGMFAPYDPSPPGDGVVTIRAVSGRYDRRGPYSPENDVSENNKLRKLLWLERDAATILTGVDWETPIIAQVDGGDGAEREMKFPIRASEESVMLEGGFSVMPETHFGYAVTWFGLSGFGAIMTMMLFRGKR